MFITDIISETYKLWQLGTLVLISAPTGIGKTFFILNVLLPYAMENGVEILFISNRTMLNQELVRKVCNIYGLPYELMQNKNIAEFPGITIMTYQTLQQMLSGDLDYSRIPFFYYVVADEIHYLCSDSEFSPEVQRFYKWFMNCNYPVKIAISATMESVLPFLFDVNCGWVDFLSADNITVYRRTPHCFKNFALNQLETCFFYKVEGPVRNFKLLVYDTLDDLIEVINDDSSDAKWLVFQSNKDKAHDLLQNLSCSATILTASNKDSVTMRSIIENNSFEEKALITTKVLDNGVSLHDPKIKNIVLSTTSKTDFLQMLGRKRISPDGNEMLKIYIPKMTPKYFENALRSSIEPGLQLFELPISKVMEVCLSSEEGRKLVRQYYDLVHGKLTLNVIAKNELKKKAEFYRTMADGLKNDPNLFVKEQLLWLGGIDIEEVTFLHDEITFDALEDLISILNEQSEMLLTKKEQADFRNKVSPLLLMLCPNMFEHSERIAGHKKINQCLKHLDLPFTIESKYGKKKGEQTQWIIKRTN